MKTMKFLIKGQFILLVAFLKFEGILLFIDKDSSEAHENKSFSKK